MADTRLKERSLFDPEIVRPAIWESFRKLTPQHVIKNPVMFVVEIGSVLTTLILVRDLFAPTAGSQPLVVHVQRYFLAVVHGAFSPISPKRSRKGAARPRRRPCARCEETNARRLLNGRREEIVPASRSAKATCCRRSRRNHSRRRRRDRRHRVGG